MASMVVPYRHDMGGHCGSGALRDLTEWAGIRWGDDTPDEGIVFALGGVDRTDNGLDLHGDLGSILAKPRSQV